MSTKWKSFVVFLFFVSVTMSVTSHAKNKKNPETLKPRIVVLTDVSTWETDDSESLVRLFSHADLFEIEGLIYTTGWSLEETPQEFFQLIHHAIDAYEKDVHNLMKRSNQKAFGKNEEHQYIGYWPSPEYLRKRTMFGSKKRGIQFIGKENVSPGSDLIIQLADEDDERPLWILCWGGANTLAQAIWQVKQERNGDELKKFLKKVPTYAITDQDRSYVKNTPFDISAQQWLRKEFEKDLFYLWDESAWLYQNGTGKIKWEEYETNIQNHGNLGKVYPKYKFGVEGDTPALFHVIPNGLNDPFVPTQVGWGGYFEWGVGLDGTTFAFNNHHGTKANKIASRYEAYFYPATFNEFAARMDWAHEGKGNRNPIVIVNNVPGHSILAMSPKQGEKVVLNASKSFDPEKDRLTYKWWIIQEAGTYTGEVMILNKDTHCATIEIPSDAVGKTFHVICEVTDNGMPNLTSYRRIIFTPQ